MSRDSFEEEAVKVKPSESVMPAPVEPDLRGSGHKNGEKNNETLTFNQDGSFTYKGVSNGEQDNDTGSWSTENNQLIIDLINMKTMSKYKILDNVLTIIIHDKKTDDYHAFDTVLEYKKRIWKSSMDI